MARNTTSPIIELTSPNQEGNPLYLHLAEHIKSLILVGTLPRGKRMPSSRQMSLDLKCSRNTVIGALDHLISEGYLEARERSGTYVSDVIPEDVLTTPGPAIVQEMIPGQHREIQISSAAAHTAQSSWRDKKKLPAFSRQPDTSVFPFDIWSSLFFDVWKNGMITSLNSQDPMGYMPFRSAIAEHLALWRGIQCRPENIMVTQGTTHAMNFLARLLLNAGDVCWVEEPGFLEAKSALYSVGAEPFPVPCDKSGLKVSEGEKLCPTAKACFVTPSHQHPLGMPMSAQRRDQLLTWARNANAWIIEDDHDAEIRHKSQPHPTIKSSDTADCVIYVGTFCKSTFQSIRLGYIVFPECLVSYAKKYRSATEVCPPISIQPVMQRFLEGGYFSAHLRRSRKLYNDRKKAFRKIALSILPSEHKLFDDDIGTHLILIFNPSRNMSDVVISRHLGEHGVSATPLSRYYLGDDSQQGLVLGYGSLEEKEMTKALGTLTKILEDYS